MDIQESPFHQGEKMLQAQSGVRDTMEQFGRRVIRDHLPSQHQEFYRQLPFIVLGYSDTAGWPWVSVLAGEPGFMQSRQAENLQLRTSAIAGDPLFSILHAGAPVGALGIEPHTRRRNRFSAQVGSADTSGVILNMRQTFGNCPQYIQANQLQYDSALDSSSVSAEWLDQLDEDAVRLIENSDTFFVASQTRDDAEVSDGADVSHRGGRPGFVLVESSRDTDETGVEVARWQLTVPDYPGNNHFNTLGNFVLNPRAGLLFWDLETSSVLMLTGEVELLEEHPDLPFFQGAQRFWRFTLRRGLRLNGALPLRGRMGDVSPNNAMTGTWAEARDARRAHQLRNEFSPYRVLSRVEESDSVVSFELAPVNGAPPEFIAGQYLSLRITSGVEGRLKSMIRTYTVSSAPGVGRYRISVKRVPAVGVNPAGEMSGYLHDFLQEGDVVEVKAPQGQFCWHDDSERPAVMLAAGIGITPMMSMAQQILRDQLRLRRYRSATMILIARNRAEQAFFTELSELASTSQGFLRVFWCLTEPESDLVLGRDYHLKGRPDRASLQSVLSLDDYDFYLCGPGGFMQAMYDELLALGVSQGRIASEAFGPSSLLPKTDLGVEVVDTVASAAAVKVLNAEAVEILALPWSPDDGSLLEFSEAHGLQPEFGCRSGRCGSCAVTLLEGEVTHDPGSIQAPQGQALLCCAKPASDAVVVQLNA